MTQKAYTSKQKQTAVALYLTEGATVAAASFGCSRQAIYSWLGLFGVDSDNDQKRAATAERHLAKRAALLEAALDAALFHAVASMNAAIATDAQRHAVAFGIFDDKLNRPTAPSEPFVLTEEFLNREIARLETELGRVTPNNRKNERTDIDVSIGQAMEEWERKIRSDTIRELTGRDELGRAIAPEE